MTAAAVAVGMAVFTAAVPQRVWDASIEHSPETSDNESRMATMHETSDGTAKPQDYEGLKAELADLLHEISPVMHDVWPRLEDHKYRWELHHFGVEDGYDKLVVSDIISHLVEALKGLGAADHGLMRASSKADSHNPGQATDSS